MPAPKAVRDQARVADQMSRDFAAGKPVAAPAPAAGPEPTLNLPNVGAPVPPDAQPPSAAAPAPAPAAAAAPPAQPETIDWKHKFEVLQGKYNAEVPRLLDAVNESRTIADQATRQNQELINQLRGAQPAPAPTRREETFQPLVTEQEKQAFGEDLIDVVGRRAREVVLPELRSLLQQELQPIRQATARQAAETAQQAQARVYQALNDQVQGWAQINESVQFLAWLEGVDVFSGSSRRQALDSAFKANDASRVVGIFQAFQREDASVRPTSGPAVDAETLVAPGAPRGGNTQEVAPGGSRGKIWSEGEIRDFYDRVRHKKVKPDEYAQVQADLAAAAREGRIRPDRPDIHMNQR